MVTYHPMSQNCYGAWYEAVVDVNASVGRKTACWLHLCLEYTLCYFFISMWFADFSVKLRIVWVCLTSPIWVCLGAIRETSSAMEKVWRNILCSLNPYYHCQCRAVEISLPLFAYVFWLRYFLHAYNDSENKYRKCKSMRYSLCTHVFAEVRAQCDVYIK